MLKKCKVCNIEFKAKKSWSIRCDSCEEKRLNKCRRCGQIFRFNMPMDKFCLQCMRKPKKEYINICKICGNSFISYNHQTKRCTRCFQVQILNYSIINLNSLKNRIEKKKCIVLKENKKVCTKLKKVYSNCLKGAINDLKATSSLQQKMFSKSKDFLKTVRKKNTAKQTADKQKFDLLIKKASQPIIKEKKVIEEIYYQNILAEMKKLGSEKVMQKTGFHKSIVVSWINNIYQPTERQVLTLKKELFK